ncbi:MAG: hypothetical protein M5U18_14385 [Dehalococcoidia bacterium]|nr:hypothetical protein [Dehalococcoidia bacterium]
MTDVFRGSHTNSAGRKEGPFALAGVNWSVTLAAGSCGTLNGFAAGSGSLPITGVTQLAANGTVTGGPNVTFDEGGANHELRPRPQRHHQLHRLGARPAR